MKKILLFSLSAAFMLSSCTNNDGTAPALQSGVTFYSSINSAATRVAENQFEEGDAISVFAKSGDAYISENVKYEYVGGLFTSSSPVVSDGSALSFVAAYPYGSDVAVSSTFSASADQSSAEAYEASDLLTASLAATTEATPKLVFSHALSAVEININSTKTVEAALVNASVSLAYDLEEGSFASNGSAVAVTPLSVSSTSYLAVVAPQTIAAGSAFIEVAVDGVTSQWNISEAITLQSGYKYICNVTVTDNDVVFAGQITPWSDGGEIDATVGGDDPEEATGIALSEISADSIPEGDTWTIADASATTEDFAGLYAALLALNDSDREISLVFSALTAFPNNALYNSTDYGTYGAISSLVAVSAPKAEVIGEYVFPRCTALTSLNFPNVTTVEQRGFINSTGITEVNFPKVESIGQYCFLGCISLQTVTLPELTSMGTNAFKNCSKLSYIECAKLEVITEYALNSCVVLTSAIFPSVTQIDANAFNACDAIESVSFENLVTIGEAAFISCDKLATLDLPKLVTVGSYAFGYCASLGGVDLPLAEEIGSFAFLYCGSIVDVNLPKVTNLGQSSLSYCTSMQSVSLPSVTTVGSTAIYNYSASNFTSLEIATNDGCEITSLGRGAFGYNDEEEGITVTIGSANAANIDGNTLTVSGESFTFKEIVVI